MKPYYDHAGITIYHGDCREVLPTLTEKVDLVLTSPPYNMRTRVRNGKYTERERGESFSKKYAHFDDAMEIDEFYRFHRGVMDELLRLSDLVAYNIQIVTGSKEAFFKMIGDYRCAIKEMRL